MTISKRNQNRNQNGAALGLVIVLTLVMSMLVLAFFRLTLCFGGADETRNATDAGALNAGKQSFVFNVRANSPDEHQFDDVADKNGNFNLTNINRVWAKAMLANINVAAETASGHASALATVHADQLYKAADSISGRLSEQLNNPKNFYDAFESITKDNNARMLGANAKVAALKDSGWSTSEVDRGQKSNINFKAEQLPLGFNNSLFNPASVSDGMHIPGYQAIPVLDKKFYLVSFNKDERTHLSNPEKFDGNTNSAKPLDGWKNPVPNAFRVHGQTLGQDSIAQQAVSWVQVNPQKEFDLSMPHSFIRVKLQDNKLIFQNLTSGDTREDSYSYMPKDVTEVLAAGTGALTVTAHVGLEFTPPTVYQAIYGVPGNHEKVTQVLLQRCREILKDYSADQLLALLNKTPIQPGVSDYIIYPVGKTALAMGPATMASQSANWLTNLIQAQADGQKQTIGTGHCSQPNFVDSPELHGVGATAVPGTATLDESSQEDWTPGSGFDGCLGELSVSKTTSVNCTGLMVPAESVN